MSDKGVSSVDQKTGKKSNPAVKIGLHVLLLASIVVLVGCSSDDASSTESSMPDDFDVEFNNNDAFEGEDVSDIKTEENENGVSIDKTEIAESE